LVERNVIFAHVGQKTIKDFPSLGGKTRLVSFEDGEGMTMCERLEEKGDGLWLGCQTKVNNFLINLEGAYKVANGSELFENMMIIVERRKRSKSTNVADNGLKSALMHVRSFWFATLQEMLCS